MCNPNTKCVKTDAVVKKLKPESLSFSKAAPEQLRAWIWDHNILVQKGFQISWGKTVYFINELT